MKKLLLPLTAILLLLSSYGHGDLLQNSSQGDLLTSQPSTPARSTYSKTGSNTSESSSVITERLKRILRRAADEAEPGERDFINSYLDVLSGEEALELYIGPCRYITSNYIKRVKSFAKRMGHSLKIYAVPGSKSEYRFDRTLAEELKGFPVRYLPVSEIRRKGITEIPALRTPGGTVIFGTQFDHTGTPRSGKSGETCRVEQLYTNKKKTVSISVSSDELNRELQEAVNLTMKYRAVSTIPPHTDSLKEYTLSIQEITGRKIPVSIRGFLIFAKKDIEKLKGSGVWDKYPGCCVDCNLRDVAILYPLYQICTEGLLKALRVKSVPSLTIFVP
jgi:hypothetical protein